MKNSLFFKVLTLSLATLMATACSGGTTPKEDDEPKTGEDKYQVTEAYWTSNITQSGYFGVNSNLTLSLETKVGGSVTSNSKIENANGDMHFYVDGETDIYLDLLNDGSYDVYTKENGEWKKETVPATYMVSLQYIYTYFINPWTYSAFTYNSETHAYEKASDTISIPDTEGNVHSVELSNIAFKFEDNKFISLYYEGSSGEMTASAMITGSLWGTTSITFPSVIIDGGEDPEVIPVDNILVEPRTLELKVTDRAVQLHATVTPENATNKTVTWTSDNQEVAVVDQNGYVTPLSVGRAVITAAAGHKDDTCVVTVVDDSTPVVEVERVSLDKNSHSMKVGESVKINATLYPENATQGVNWTISDSDLATLAYVGNTATVAALKAGTVVVSAKANEKAQDICVIVISEEEKPQEKDPFVGVTLKYKANSLKEAGYNPMYPEYDSAWAENFLSTITISLFAGSVSEAGGVSNPTFEVYSKGADGVLNYALFGEFLSDGSYCEMAVETYFNGSTGKYVHGDKIGNYGQPVMDINSGISFDAETALYTIGSYIYSSDPGNFFVKGNFVFEKVNETPVHLSGLPEDKPEEEDYSKLLENKVFEYTHYTVSVEDADFKDMVAIVTDMQFSFFEENVFEIVMDDSDAAMIGTYRVEPTNASHEYSGEGIYAVYFIPLVMYTDGQEMRIEDGESQADVYYFDSATNELILYSHNEQYLSPTGEVKYANIFVYYGLVAEKVPTHYVPPVYDEWDAERVAAAFEAIGVNGFLPKYDGVKIFAIDPLNTVDKTFTIKLVMPSSSSVIKYYQSYINYLTGELGFEIVIDKQSSSIMYISANGEFSLQTNLLTEDNVFVVSLVVSKYVVYYPEAEIAAYMQKQGYDELIIDFHAQGATSYQFDGENGSLAIMFKANTNVQKVASDFVTALLEINYEPRELKEGYTVYVSTSEEIALTIGYISQDGIAAVYVAFLDASTLPSTRYPDRFVDAVLDGTSDIFPYFGNENAISYVTEKATEYWPVYGVRVYLPEGTNINKVVEDLIANALENSYTQKNFTLTMNKGAEDGGKEMYFYDYYVSDEEEIAFQLLAYEDHYLLNFINLTNYDVEIERPRVAEMYIHDYTEEYNVGDEFVFDGVVTLIMSDDSEKVIPFEYLTPTNPVDLSKAGYYEFEYTYTEDEVTVYDYIKLTISDNTPATRRYEFKNTDTWDISVDSAKFGVWAWGGSYGDGQLVPVTHTSRGGTHLFYFNLFADCEGFQIVRLDPAYNAETFDYESDVWNASEDFDPTEIAEDASLVEFAFGGGEPQEEVENVALSYHCTNVTLGEAGAIVKVWAWGGTYGDGQWVDVELDEENNIASFELASDCTGFKIVRINPEYRDLEDENWSWRTAVWNETGNMSIPADVPEGAIDFRL